MLPQHDMPRYFFHITDGHTSPDAEGTVLPDIYTAQEQAIRMAGELLREMIARFWNGTEWSLEVADEEAKFFSSSASRPRRPGGEPCAP